MATIVTPKEDSEFYDEVRKLVDDPITSEKIGNIDIQAEEYLVLDLPVIDDEPLPSFDVSIERTAPDRSSEALSDAIASGEVEVTRKSVSVEEVIAKIEELEDEK